MLIFYHFIHITIKKPIIVLKNLDNYICSGCGVIRDQKRCFSSLFYVIKGLCNNYLEGRGLGNQRGGIGENHN